MDQQKIKSDIINKFSILLNNMPADIRKSTLLTGGSAAFLYGSDRPFSDDIDIMVPKKITSKLEKLFKTKFSYNEKKPVFHSLKTSIIIDKTSYDVIAESVIEPFGSGKKCRFYLTDEIIERKENFFFKNNVVACIPKEMLVLIKLLAGRGKELNKYDIYDVNKILKKGNNFDYQFFKKLTNKFCKPIASAVSILIKNARLLDDKDIMLDALQSLQQFPQTL